MLGAWLSPVVLLSLLIAGGVWILRHLVPSYREARRRQGFEDALKHLLVGQHAGQAVRLDSLAGALHQPSRCIMDIVARMEAAGLVQSAGGQIKLSAKGEEWAVQILRAHRLWECYLADDANVHLQDVHRIAEQAEHRLTAAQVNALEAHLGYPMIDPHGDPIPSASGAVDAVESCELTDWPVGKPACIVHIEDEPDEPFQRILSLGLRPGQAVLLSSRSLDRLVLCDGGRDCELSPAMAAQIHVSPAVDAVPLPADAVPLSTVTPGRSAEIVALDTACRGLMRRRLLDLGLTCGAQVSPAFSSPFGTTRAFRVRGTLVALRLEQAQLVWVRPTARPALRYDEGR